MNEPIYFPASSNSSMIYMTCLILSIGTVIALPFLKTEVSVNAAAIIRPASEITTLHSLTSGRLKTMNLHENKKVVKGETLLIIESESLLEQKKYFEDEIEHLQSFSNDLREALRTSSSTSTIKRIPSFQNALYAQEYFSYQQKTRETNTHLEKVKQDFNRQSRLFTERVISNSEFESSQYELKKAEESLNQLHETQRTQWQNELKNLNEKIREIESQILRIQKEMNTYIVTAPVSGTIQNITPLYPGSMVSASSDLAQISPDTSLIVLAYLSPNDIGLIKKEMNVRFQIDAFNHNQWGLANGNVIEIPIDMKIIDNKPVFEVRCRLNQEYLQLKNGFKGYLKKGMTLQSRFIVTERSLWQLLYDKVDNWINPNL